MQPGTVDVTPPGAAAHAARLRLPSWRDPRLLVGVVLVLASVSGTWWLVRQADTTTPVYAASTALVTGEVVGPEDLRVVRAQLGGAAGHYLTPGARVVGRVVARTVAPGELLAVAALDGPGRQDRQPVAVPVEAGLSGAVRRGALVDVWAAAPGETAGAHLAPRAVLSRAPVAGVTEDHSALGTRRGSVVELMVPSDALPELLAALTDGSSITLVPSAASRP